MEFIDIITSIIVGAMFVGVGVALRMCLKTV